MQEGKNSQGRGGFQEGGEGRRRYKVHEGREGCRRANIAEMLRSVTLHSFMVGRRVTLHSFMVGWVWGSRKGGGGREEVAQYDEGMK